MAASTFLIVQSNNTGNGGSFSENVVAGHKLVALFIGWTGTFTTVTDSQGTTWTPDSQYVDGTTGRGMGLFSATAASTGACAVTMNGISVSPEILLFELETTSGNSIIFDKAAQNAGSGTAINCGTISTAHATSIIIAGAYLAQTVTAGGSGYTWNSADLHSNLSEYKVVNAAGSYNATGTQAPTGNYAGIVGAYTDQTGLQSTILLPQASNNNGFNYNVQTGSRIIAVYYGWTGGAPTGVSDNLGNTYAIDESYTGVTRNLIAFSAPVTVAGALTALTTSGGSPSGGEWFVFESLSSAGSVVFDKAASNSGNSASVNCGSLTTKYDDSVILAFAWLANSPTGGETNWIWFSQDAGGNLSELTLSNARGLYTGTGTQSAAGDFDGIVIAYTDQTNATFPDGNFQDLVLS